MPIFHEFPYGNMHDQNMDWILKVVKDFFDKYNNVESLIQQAVDAINEGKTEALGEIDVALTAAINDITSSQASALNAIGDSKDSALASIATALGNATDAISTLSTTAQTQITNLKNTSISEITTAQGTAISAITASKNHATTIIEQLYNTLPASAQDILGKIDILDNIITGNTMESFTWLQGDYVYPEGVTPPTPPAINTENVNYNYVVSNRYMTGAAGRRLRVITDGTINMVYLLVWRNTPPGGSSSGAYVPGQADYFTSTYLDLLLPLDITAFSLTLSKPGYSDTISPTDISGHIEIQWITDFVGQSIIAPKESSSTADVARAAGEYFFLDGELYIATDDIAVGDTIAEGTNCEKKSVGGELSELKSAITYNANRVDEIIAFENIDFTYTQENWYIDSRGQIKSNNSARAIYLNCLPNKVYRVQKTPGTRFSVGCTDSLPDVDTQCTAYAINHTGSTIDILTTDYASYLVIYYWYSTDSITDEEMLASVRIKNIVSMTEYKAKFENLYYLLSKAAYVEEPVNTKDYTVSGIVDIDGGWMMNTENGDGYIQSTEEFSPSGPWEVELRIKPKSVNNFNDIVSTSKNGAANYGFILECTRYDDDRMYCRVYFKVDGETESVKITSTLLTVNSWVNIKFGYDGSNFYLTTIYSNGREYTETISGGLLSTGFTIDVGRTVNGKFNGEIDLSSVVVHSGNNVIWRAVK